MEARVHAAGAAPTRGPVGGAGPAGRVPRLRPPLGLRPRRDRAPARAHPRVRGLHHAGRPLAADLPGRPGSTGHLCLLPQRRSAGQGGGLYRRVLGRAAHPRARCRLVPRGVPLLRVRVPGQPRVRLAVLDETLEVVRRLWTEETVTFDGDHLHFDGAYCDPKPVQQLPPVLVGGGGEQGQPPHRRPAGRLDQLAGGAGGLRTQIGPAGPVLRGGGPARSRTSPGPMVPTAGCSTPRPRPVLVRIGRRRESLGRRSRPSSTWPTTWSGPSTRSSRRPRRSWTPAAGA